MELLSPRGWYILISFTTLGLCVPWKTSTQGFMHMENFPGGWAGMWGMQGHFWQEGGWGKRWWGHPVLLCRNGVYKPLCLEGARTYRLQNWMKWLTWRQRGKWSQCFAMIVLIKGLHQGDSGENWFLTPKIILGTQVGKSGHGKGGWGLLSSPVEGRRQTDRGVGFPKSLKEKNLKIWWWIAFADDLGSRDWK